MYKLTSSNGINALKLAVFLGEKRGFRLRIPLGKLTHRPRWGGRRKPALRSKVMNTCFPNPSAFYST